MKMPRISRRGEPQARRRPAHRVCGTVALLILGWGWAAPARAPEAKLPAVSSAGGKRIRVALGALRRVIDLSREISGCTELYDPAEPARRIRDAARIGVVDRVFKGRKHYLVLWALANANCNVQGHCGAGEDCTLVWLRLDENLGLEKAQAVVVQECRAEVGVPDMDLEDPGARLRLAGGRLDLQFGDLIADAPAWTRVLYERGACEKGLIIAAPPG